MSVMCGVEKGKTRRSNTEDVQKEAIPKLCLKCLSSKELIRWLAVRLGLEWGSVTGIWREEIRPLSSKIHDWRVPVSPEHLTSSGSLAQKRAYSGDLKP